MKAKPTYTGHKDLKINKQNIVEYLKPTVKEECNYYSVDMPTDKQIAVVVRALRMHHTLVHASEYDYSELHDPKQKTDFYPIQSSIGRYFRDSVIEVLEQPHDQK